MAEQPTTTVTTASTVTTATTITSASTVTTASVTEAKPSKTRASTPVRSKSQIRKQRVQLIAALSRHKPSDATPLQYYNFLREHCIMHNCSIDEAIEQAESEWPKVTQQQRAVYASEKHAELPIPVPTHLIYRAFQMQRDGRWSLGRAPIGHKGGTMYTVEAYRPPRELTSPKYPGHVLRNSREAAVWGATGGCGCRQHELKKSHADDDQAPQRLSTQPALSYKSLRVDSLTGIAFDESVNLQLQRCHVSQKSAAALLIKRSKKLLGILMPTRCKTGDANASAANGAGGDSQYVTCTNAPAAAAGGGKKSKKSKKSLKKFGNAGDSKRKIKSAKTLKSATQISASIGTATLRHLAQHYPRPSF